MFSPKKKQNKKTTPNKEKNLDYLKNPEILEVNLVKDEVVVLFDWNRHLFLALLTFIFAGLFVFEIYLGLDYWEKKENQKALKMTAETEQLKKDIIDLTNESQDALSFKDKSAAFSDLLDNHVYWTRFFTWLEANTLNTVKYEGFSGDLSGTYSFNASAPSFAEASWQVKVLENNDNVKKVSVNSVTSNAPDPESGEVLDALESEEVKFLIDLEISREIFKKK
ncbi:hypothetical protein JXK06_03370 [Patescibacteria group bacterium]|nr:hypothetical protein [Patescibacteria group bacterium]